MIRTSCIAIATLLLPIVQMSQPISSAPSKSKGVYRLPFADGTAVRVFDDFTTHHPLGRLISMQSKSTATSPIKWSPLQLVVS
jgi:hypothetical protein